MDSGAGELCHFRFSTPRFIPHRATHERTSTVPLPGSATVSAVLVIPEAPKGSIYALSRPLKYAAAIVPFVPYPSIHWFMYAHTSLILYVRGERGLLLSFNTSLYRTLLSPLRRRLLLLVRECVRASQGGAFLHANSRECKDDGWQIPFLADTVTDTVRLFVCKSCCLSWCRR